jgi:hypothetical protein
MFLMTMIQSKGREEAETSAEEVVELASKFL